MLAESNLESTTTPISEIGSKEVLTENRVQLQEDDNIVIEPVEEEIPTQIPEIGRIPTQVIPLREPPAPPPRRRPHLQTRGIFNKFKIYRLLF